MGEPADDARTILMVDDVAMFRELGSLFLARAGRVITASDGVEALALAREEHPAVIVCDLEMPQMGGEDLCRAVKADPALAETPVILLVASHRADDHARAVRAGADDALPKPLNRVTLLESVNRFLRFERARGLPRVELATRVRIRHGEAESWGVVRNLSRGGIFIESEPALPLDAELALEFDLPETARTLAPTARVVWQRSLAEGRADGMGLRFVALDAATVRCLEDYVHERAVGPRASEGAFRT